MNVQYFSDDGINDNGDVKCDFSAPLPSKACMNTTTVTRRQSVLATMVTCRLKPVVKTKHHTTIYFYYFVVGNLVALR